MFFYKILFPIFHRCIGSVIFLICARRLTLTSVPVANQICHSFVHGRPSTVDHPRSRQRFDETNARNSENGTADRE